LYTLAEFGVTAQPAASVLRAAIKSNFFIQDSNGKFARSWGTVGGVHAACPILNISGTANNS
jgi:hypothetical protein